MLSFKLTLSGSGGELDSCVVWVSADDQSGLRLKLTRWLEKESVILAHGDSITVTAVSGAES
jgi:hypothetical protein